jgi:hypothetical protein
LRWIKDATADQCEHHNMTEWTLVIATVLGLIAGALVSAADEKFLSHYSNRSTLRTTLMSSDRQAQELFMTLRHFLESRPEAVLV